MVLYFSLFRNEPQVTFPGLILDERLSYFSLIIDLKSRCHRSLDLLTQLTSISCGSDRRTLVQFFTGFVLCKLDYVCVIHGQTSKFYLRLIDTLQNARLRNASEVFRSSLKVSLEVETSLISLSL